MPRSDEARLGDMRASCDRIGGFVADMKFDQFRADDRTVRAVLYELVVIGEAAKGVSEATRGRFPSLPWKQVAGMRDIVVHQYHGIMLDVVWDTVSRRVPELRRQLAE